MIWLQFLVISTILIGGLTIVGWFADKFGSTHLGERFVDAIDHLIAGDPK